MPATAISELQIAVKTSLTPAELDDAFALVSEAHWNQVAADWKLFVEHGRVYAAHAASGRMVATSAILPYGTRFGWISMVLVAGPYRRRGLATLLMRRAMDDLAAARLVPVLDATPDGRTVYGAAYQVHRATGIDNHFAVAVVQCQGDALIDLQDAGAVDRGAAGVSRHRPGMLHIQRSAGDGGQGAIELNGEDAKAGDRGGVYRAGPGDRPTVQGDGMATHGQ